jgi:hypothetical protein
MLIDRNVVQAALEALEAARLREVIDYEPETGVLRWRVDRANRVRAGDLAGSAHVRGYWRIGIDGRDYLAHRLAWFHFHGTWPADRIDHVNGDRADNRIANLRSVSNSINQQNQRAARANNSVGLLGVSPNGKKWSAEIKLNGRRTCLGTFPTPELAHAAYVSAKRAMHLGCTI